MAEASVAVKCDCGREAERALSAFAVTRGPAGAMPLEMPMGGGCCGGGGGGCACASAN